jgi:hypothetical protein
MGYSVDDSMVRVDFFRPSGKWHDTQAVKWTGSFTSGLVSEEFAKTLRDYFKDAPNRYGEMDAVCLEPCHRNAYPLMIRAGRWRLASDEKKED